MLGTSRSIASRRDSSVKAIGLHIDPIGSGGNDQSEEVNKTRWEANIKKQLEAVVTSWCAAIGLVGLGWSMANGSPEGREKGRESVRERDQS